MPLAVVVVPGDGGGARTGRAPGAANELRGRLAAALVFTGGEQTGHRSQVTARNTKSSQ